MTNKHKLSANKVMIGGYILFLMTYYRWLQCGGCEGQSTAPLHSRSVRCDLAKFTIIYPDILLDYKLATLPADVHNLRRKVAHDMHADQLQIA
jgi:hypothetical protein